MSLLGFVFGLFFDFRLVFVCCWVVGGFVVVHFYVEVYVGLCGVGLGYVGVIWLWGCSDAFETKRHVSPV